MQELNRNSKIISFVDRLPGIIKGCKKQNPKSQKELYDLFADKLFGVCVRYCNNYTDAQDVLQDGFIKIFEKIQQFSNRGAFEGWMRRIMVNTALEKFRSPIKNLTSEDNIAKYQDVTYYDNINDQLNEKELLNIIKELSPKYRVVFNLYAIEGYSHKEISEMLGVSEGTSKSNLSRARAILQDKVARYYQHVKVVV